MKESVEPKRMLEVQVGDVIIYDFGAGRQNGEIVRIIPPNEKPTRHDVEVYYNLTPEDRLYTEVSRPTKVQRLVVKKTNGYVIIPNTVNLRGWLYLNEEG